MVCLPGLASKIYWQLLFPGAPFPEVACPNPSCLGCLLRPHGWYRRYLNGEMVSIRRGLCKRCRVSHALLPEDVCAYQDLTLPALERAMETEGGPGANARAAGYSDGAAVRRARRWLRGRLWRQLETVLPAAGNAWDKVVALVGKAPGKLVRLRHWMAKKLGYLLGGPCGLFRHGRPGPGPRRGST